MSGIYPRIFTKIDSLFKAGEETLGFLTKTPSCTRICERYAMLRPVRGKRRTASRGDSTRELKIAINHLATQVQNSFHICQCRQEFDCCNMLSWQRIFHYIIKKKIIDFLTIIFTIQYYKIHNNFISVLNQLNWILIQIKLCGMFWNAYQIFSKILIVQ